MKDNWLTIEKIGQELVLTECSKEADGDIEIPDGVTRIDSYAFMDCLKIQSVTIPESVKQIGNDAFNCTFNQDGHSCVKYANMESFFNISYGNYDANPSCRADIVYINNEKITDCLIVPDTIEIISKNTLVGLKIDTLIIPSSVTKIEMQENYHKKDLKVVNFEGKIPETNNSFNNFNIRVLRVNTPRKQTTFPDDIKEAFYVNPRTFDRSKIVYAVPELCKEQSQVPGYIKVTNAFDDELVDINTKYIVSIELYDFNNSDNLRYNPDLEKYHPHVGSLIKCAANSNERGVEYFVYEPPKIVWEKIKLSLSMLSQQVGGIAGLLNQIETLYKKGQTNN